MEIGRHGDGGGLYLVVGTGASRKWVFRYRWNGRLVDMGLGSAVSLPLTKARERAAEARQLLAEGISPLEVKKAQRSTPTFGEVAHKLIASLEPQWRNAKHRAQWRTTLEEDAAALRPLRVDKIQTADVLAVLQPIWTTKPETASRLRGRIERVLDAAKAQGYRDGENPARWRGHLDHLLPRPAKLNRGHHKAMRFEDVSGFVRKLRQHQSMAALALEFLIYTAARSGEVRGALWSEIDLEARLWVIPAARMKAGRVHRVPLAARPLEILAGLRPLARPDGDSPILPSNNGKPLSDAAFSALIVRMGYSGRDFTPHGFRSSFRDWAGELTEFPRELAETALAHVVGDATERAYRRGDALEKRRTMMDAWAAYIEPA